MFFGCWIFAVIRRFVNIFGVETHAVLIYLHIFLVSLYGFCNSALFAVILYKQYYKNVVSLQSQLDIDETSTHESEQTQEIGDIEELSNVKCHLMYQILTTKFNNFNELFYRNQRNEGLTCVFQWNIVGLY